MPIIDPRIDEYTSKAAKFAKPILKHLRASIHRACPDCRETIKWSFPHFEYAGNILCSMAAFKQHCAFTFWLGSLLADPDKILAAVGEKTSMGHLGQLKSLDDLPPDKILVKYVKEAMALNEKGVKLKKEKVASSKEIEIPSYLLDALKQTNNAFGIFENLSPSHKREENTWNG